jgi:hypothetical protein
MFYALANRIGGFMPTALDPDAQAYIDDIVAAGATVSGAQKKSISTFYETGKDEGWYDQLKRLYLPVWGVAAANAIDLITTNSGTFSGTVTHATGYIQGNGSTGRLAMDASPDTIGLADGNASVSCLIYSPQSSGSFNVPIGVTQTSKKLIRISLIYTSSPMTVGGGIGVDINSTSQDGLGIYVVSETASNSRFFRKRKTSGVSSLGTSTASSTGGFPTVAINLMAVNNGGSISGYSTSQIGAAHAGLAMTTTQADQYTAALKTMWEACSGLTLP